MPAWKIIWLRENEELEIGYIDENNRISGWKAKSIKQCLARHGWPKVTPADVYAKRTDVRAVEADPRIAESKRPLFSRPKDNASFEEFKAWIIEMTNHLTGKSGSDGSMTEAEWEAGWKKFWSEADGGS